MRAAMQYQSIPVQPAVPAQPFCEYRDTSTDVRDPDLPPRRQDSPPSLDAENAFRCTHVAFVSHSSCQHRQPLTSQSETGSPTINKLIMPGRISTPCVSHPTFQIDPRSIEHTNMPEHVLHHLSTSTWLMPQIVRTKLGFVSATQRTFDKFEVPMSHRRTTQHRHHRC